MMLWKLYILAPHSLFSLHFTVFLFIAYLRINWFSSEKLEYTKLSEGSYEISHTLLEFCAK